MNEVALVSALTVIGGIQQHLLGVLASRDMVSLRDLHTQLTSEISAHLAQKNPTSAEPHPAEEEILSLLDRTFLAAHAVEESLRDGPSD